jgi:hypothetical protein
MTLIPLMVSEKRVLISATLTRSSRNTSRTRLEKPKAAITTSGSTRKVNRASCQSMASRTTAMPDQQEHVLEHHGNE